jgi:hypothetical protein
MRRCVNTDGAAVDAKGEAARRVARRLLEDEREGEEEEKEKESERRVGVV